jgi:hypothetical protein
MSNRMRAEPWASKFASIMGIKHHGHLENACAARGVRRFHAGEPDLDGAFCTRENLLPAAH